MTPDEQFAVDLAAATGEILQRTRQQNTGLALAELKDLGDRHAQAEIATWLAAAFPDDAVLSEEAADDRARTARDRVWIIDPLDGTREFAEGRADWAVHVALWQRLPSTSGDLIVGAVAVPDEGMVLSSADRTPMPARLGGPLRIAVSRTRPPALITELAEGLRTIADSPVQLVPMGSAGVKIAGVVLGQVDAYVHAGGQYEWDSAAPVCVARAAGAYTARLDGSPLAYNQPDPYLPDLVVCRPEYARPIMEALRTIQ